MKEEDYNGPPIRQKEESSSGWHIRREVNKNTSYSEMQIERKNKQPERYTQMTMHFTAAN